MTKDELDTKLVKAVDNRSLHEIEVAIEQGADVNAMNGYPLRWSSAQGEFGIVKHLVENGADIHIEDDWPIRHSVSCGHLDITKYLFSKGADLYAVYDEVLQSAISNGHHDIVYFLHTTKRHFNISKELPI